MRTLRNALLMLGALTVLVVGGDALARSAYCADCDQAEHDCVEQEIQKLNDCCQFWGCSTSGWAVNYCADQANDTYVGCMMSKGCAPRQH